MWLRIHIVAGFLLLIVLFIGCERDQDNSATYSNGIHTDTLEKWLAYARSSDEGIWAADQARAIRVDRVDTYGGAADLSPPFFKADFISAFGDTIYIADGSQEALVAMNSTGERLWITGQLGEGPGDFAMIGSVSRCSDVIAVCNNSNSRLDFFSTEGKYLSSIPVSGPQNVIMLSDSTGLVASKTQPGGDVHYFSVDSGIRRSMGEAEWDLFPNNYPRRDLFIVYHPIGRVACVSQFQDDLNIYDFETGEILHSGTRNLPASPTGGSVELFYTVYATIFTGPDSMINVPISNLMDNGEFMGSGGTRHSLVTIVDRYNWDGEYLDSYLLPDSLLGAIVYTDRLGFVGAQRGTSEIHRYERL